MSAVIRGRSLATAWAALSLAAVGCSSSHGTTPSDAATHADAAAGGSAGSAGGTAGANSGAAGVGGFAGGAAGAAGGNPGAAGAGGAVAGAGGAPDAGQATCDLTCPAHQTCVVEANTPTCACVAGYQLSGTSCVWGNVPQDPGFQNVPEGAWTVKPGATLSPAGAGYLDPGQLVFPKSGPCSRSGAVQSITMPTVAQAEPLAVKISADAACISSQGAGCWPPDTAVVINGGVITFDDQPSFIVNSACLGERAYGGTFDLEVRPLGQANCAVAHTDAIVDHVDIEPSATCPLPGTIPDGDFDGALNTWGTINAPGTTAASVAEIAPALGTDESAAAHLRNGNDCQDAEVGERIRRRCRFPTLLCSSASKARPVPLSRSCSTASRWECSPAPARRRPPTSACSRRTRV